MAIAKVGQSCSNVTPNTTDDDAYDINDELPDPTDVLEQYVEIQQSEEEEEEDENAAEYIESKDWLITLFFPNQ